MTLIFNCMLPAQTSMDYERLKTSQWLKEKNRFWLHIHFPHGAGPVFYLRPRPRIWLLNEEGCAVRFLRCDRKREFKWNHWFKLPYHAKRMKRLMTFTLMRTFVVSCMEDRDQKIEVQPLCGRATRLDGVLSAPRTAKRVAGHAQK